MSQFDIAIIGAGMAGASLAAEISGERNVLLLEAEQFPGYHSTGRSAAFWSETYGGPAIQPLTTASYTFLSAPPEGMSEHGFLVPRGALHIGTEASSGEADAMLADFAASPVRLEKLREAEIARQNQRRQLDLRGRRGGGLGLAKSIRQGRCKQDAKELWSDAGQPSGLQRLGNGYAHQHQRQESESDLPEFWRCRPI